MRLLHASNDMSIPYNDMYIYHISLHRGRAGSWRHGAIAVYGSAGGRVRPDVHEGALHQGKKWRLRSAISFAPTLRRPAYAAAVDSESSIIWRVTLENLCAPPLCTVCSGALLTELD